MLFFLMIYTCLAINQKNLKPIEPNMPSSSLIGIAKTNPRALIKMLDGADPNAINSIVTILNELIADGQQERLDLNNSIAAADSAYQYAKGNETSLTQAAGELKSAYELKLAAYNLVVGQLDAARTALETAQPDLQNEIDTLEKVRNLLEVLLSQNTPEEPELLELGSTKNGNAYLNLIAKVQADPTKIQTVIYFINSLYDKAEQQLVSLSNTVDQLISDELIAEGEKEQAHIDKSQADIILANWQQNELAAAAGVLQAAEDQYELRDPVIQEEINTLETVIQLLNGLKDEE